jgi:hypothetical protein
LVFQIARVIWFATITRAHRSKSIFGKLKNHALCVRRPASTLDQMNAAESLVAF